MMTASTQSDGTGVRSPAGHGMVLFASVLLLVLGVLNAIHGLAAIAKAHVFLPDADTHLVFTDLRAWGWVILILGALQLLAAAGLLAGNQFARWFAVVVLGLNAIGQMMIMPAYPFWSLVIIAGDAVALYGLCVYGGNRDVTR